MTGAEARLLGTAAALAFPRRAGSDGDRAVTAALAGRLEALGFTVEVEAFSFDRQPAERCLRWLLGGVALAVVGASWLVAPAPLAAVGLLAAAAAGTLVALRRAPWLDALYRRPGPVRSANVVGRRGSTSPERRVVLVAHHDSKSQSLAMPARLAATIGAAAGAGGVAALAATAAVVGGTGLPAWLAASSGAVGGLCLAALAAMTSGDESPGGVDNAGSMAVVLELAAGANPLPHGLELVVLFTGAEEDRMVGATRWLDRHHGARAGAAAVALNFDGAGSPGRTVLITRSGLGRRLAPGLERIALAAASDLGERPRRIAMAPAVGIDALPFAERGIECLTLTSGSLGPATFAVHSAGDVAGNLDGPALVRVVELARAILSRLAAEGEIETNRTSMETTTGGTT